jgi:hypothetical protein
MGSLNAMGHVLVASAAETPDALWDLCDELARMAIQDPGAGVGIHSLPDGMPRYCVHPTGGDEEFRGDDLRETLLQATVWLAGKLDPNVMWRRD